MQKQSYKDILLMITNACNKTFYCGTKEIRDSVVECATKIYIEQMRLDAYGPCVDVSAESPDNYTSDEEDTFF